MYRNLETVRKDKCLTIDDMAKVIEKSPANYYKKERGSVTVSVKEAIIIARFLEEDIYFLFEEVK